MGFFARLFGREKPKANAAEAETYAHVSQIEQEEMRVSPNIEIVENSDGKFSMDQRKEAFKKLMEFRSKVAMFNDAAVNLNIREMQAINKMLGMLNNLDKRFKAELLK